MQGKLPSWKSVGRAGCWETATQRGVSTANRTAAVPEAWEAAEFDGLCGLCRRVSRGRGGRYRCRPPGVWRPRRPWVRRHTWWSAGHDGEGYEVLRARPGLLPAHDDRELPVPSREWNPLNANLTVQCLRIEEPKSRDHLDASETLGPAAYMVVSRARWGRLRGASSKAWTSSRLMMIGSFLSLLGNGIRSMLT